MGPDKKKLEALEKKMADLGISRQDLEEKFVKSAGRGGQKVNKTNSAVFIRHKPSGLSVKSGKHRSQHLNRFIALRLLVEKIEAERSGKNDTPQKINRIKKQKLRRKRKNKKKQASTSERSVIDG